MEIGLKTLATLVKDMRQKQRDYFKSRDAMSLEEARKAEKNVDAIVKDILFAPRNKQGSLT